MRSPAVGELPRSASSASRRARRPRRVAISREGSRPTTAPGTVTFRLGRPNPLFLRLLALPFYDVLPQGTPARRRAPAPRDGPLPRRPVRRRPAPRARAQPRFRVWSQAAQPAAYADRIVVAPRPRDDRARADVLAGRADFAVTAGNWPPLGAIETHHASELQSEPCPVDPVRLPQHGVAPFDSLDARAGAQPRSRPHATSRDSSADRSARAQRASSSRRDSPAYRPVCPYTLRPNASGSWTAPDLEPARRLVRRSGTAATPVVVWADTRPRIRAVGAYLVRVLRTLGYPASLAAQLDQEHYYAYVADSRHRVQIGLSAWWPDVPAARDFFRLLSCDSFRPASSPNENVSGFCDRRLDSLVRRASNLEATDQAAAGRLFAAADRRAVEQAPLVPLISVRNVDIVSARLRDYAYHPVLGGLMLSRARVR